MIRMVVWVVVTMVRSTASGPAANGTAASSHAKPVAGALRRSRRVRPQDSSAHRFIAAWLCPSAGRLIPLGVAALLATSAGPAAAYRPFDGTDGAVADLNQVEIEYQAFGWQRSGGQTALTGPGMVFNYGFAERWEFVAQGFADIPLSPSGTAGFTDTGVFLKYVVKPGVLQGAGGFSIATEFGPLLPQLGERGTGFSWAGIVSQRWDFGAAHLNVEANLTRDQRPEAFLDVILEGPARWQVRPVVELYYDRVFGETETRSALVGAIWQVQDDLSFDAAFRHAVVNGVPVEEIRAGLTIAFDVGGKAGATPLGATFGKWDFAH